MNFFLKKSSVFFCIFFILVGSALAKSAYVTDDLQFMVRTGKDVTNKIITVAHSGTKVTVVESDGDWAYVKLPNGKKGWMLARFLVPDPPGKVRMLTFEREHNRLKLRFSKLEKETVKLREENLNLSTGLEEKKTRLAQVETAYEKLTKNSTDFFSLKEEADHIRKTLEEQKGIVEDLDARLLERNIKMLALGAGILLLGMVLGISMRKKKKKPFY